MVARQPPAMSIAVVAIFESHGAVNKRLRMTWTTLVVNNTIKALANIPKRKATPGEAIEMAIVRSQTLRRQLANQGPAQLRGFKFRPKIESPLAAAGQGHDDVLTSRYTTPA